MYTLPLLSPLLLYPHILPLSRLPEKSASALQTPWHPGYDENISFCVPHLTWPTWVSNRFGVGSRPKICKKSTRMGVTIGGDPSKNGKNTHLLVILCVTLSHKIGLNNLMNQTQIKKVNGQKQCTKLIWDYCRFSIRIHTQIVLLCAHKCRPPPSTTQTPWEMYKLIHF